MNHFPNKINLPESVNKAREERKRHMNTSMRWAIAIRSLIISAEFVGAAVFGSSALFMDAISSLVDVGCTALLYFFIKLANRPPDKNHPLGHGRYEPLAGLQLGFLLAALGAFMLIQQTWQLQHEEKGVINHYAWIIPFCAMILLEISYAISMRAAKKHDSPALAADAAHYRIDSLTSLFATVALILAAYFPEQSQLLDRLGAIGIALLMIILGIYAAKDNLNQLLDTVPDESYFEKVKNAACEVPGVLGTEKIRIQQYGPDAHVNIDVEVDPLLSVEKAHEISQQVRINIQKTWPSVRDVIVHVEPFYPGDH